MHGDALKRELGVLNLGPDGPEDIHWHAIAVSCAETLFPSELIRLANGRWRKSPAACHPLRLAHGSVIAPKSLFAPRSTNMKTRPYQPTPFRSPPWMENPASLLDSVDQKPGSLQVGSDWNLTTDQPRKRDLRSNL